MSGLEKIIEKINEDCQNECRNIENKTHEKRVKIESETIMSAKKQADEILKNAEKQCTLSDEKAKASAQLLEKRIRLQVKNEIIENSIKKAKQSLISLPTDEYFEIIKKLVLAYAKGIAGTLYFSKEDLDRMPDGFEKQLCNELNGGATVKISNTPIQTDGGFILSYNDIEENCTFSALIDTNADILRDRINAELFGAVKE